MCVCDPVFLDASARGELTKAIDQADQICPDGFCVSAHRTEWLTQFALRFPLRRDLRGDVRRKQIVYRWFVAAREEIPDSIEWLWRPDGEIGVTCFCTVVQGSTEGRLHRLHVRPKLAGQPHELKADDGFRRALEWARDFVVNWLGPSPASDRVCHGRCRDGGAG
jgi:hypothetical protein